MPEIGGRPPCRGGVAQYLSGFAPDAAAKSRPRVTVAGDPEGPLDYGRGPPKPPHHRVRLHDLAHHGSGHSPFTVAYGVGGLLKNHRTNYVESPCAGRSVAYADRAWLRLPRLEILSWTSDLCERASSRGVEGT